MFSLRQAGNDFSFIRYKGKTIGNCSFSNRLGMVNILFGMKEEWDDFVHEENESELVALIQNEIEKNKKELRCTEISAFFIGKSSKEKKKKFANLLCMEITEPNKKECDEYLKEGFFERHSNYIFAHKIIIKKEREEEKRIINRIKKDLKELTKEGYANQIQDMHMEACELYFFRKRERFLIFKKENEKYKLELEENVVYFEKEEEIKQSIKTLMDKIIKKERLEHLFQKEEASNLFLDAIEGIGFADKLALWEELRKIYEYEEIEEICIELLNKQLRKYHIVKEKECKVFQFKNTFHAILDDQNVFSGKTKVELIDKILYHKREWYIQKLL